MKYLLLLLLTSPLYAEEEIHSYKYIDILVGQSAYTTSIDFANSHFGVPYSELGFNDSGSLFNMSWGGMKNDYTYIKGIRVGAFENRIIGGNIEVSYTKYSIASAELQDKTLLPLNQSTDEHPDYLTIKSWNLEGSLLFRIPDTKFIDAYVGMGLGASFNNIRSSYIKDYKRNPFKSLDTGMIIKFPVGLRIHILKHIDVFTEFVYRMNRISMDRGIKNEDDHIMIFERRIIGGIGYKF